MATKKAVANAKKSTNKTPNAKKQATTKVTTLKAVESRPVQKKTVVNSSPRTKRFGLMRTPIAGALIAEFIGTFIFAAILVAGQGQPILALFALVGVVLAVGSISGGYVNPALVAAAWVTRRMSGIRAIAYVVAQLLGAMLALVVLTGFVNAAPAPAAADMYNAAPQLFQAGLLPEGKEWFIFMSEFVGTLILGFVVAGVYGSRRPRLERAFTIGLGVFVAMMIAGSAAAFLGASAIVNPAAAITLSAINFASIWPIVVYFIGASLGAIVGFILHDLVRATNNDDVIA